MTLAATMAQNRQASSGHYKDVLDQHPHHQQQGQAPHQLQRQPHPQHPRPSSIVHQQHHPQQPPPQPQSQHHPSSYTQGHPIASPYSQPAAQPNAAQPSQETLSSYYGTHPSPYSTPGATSGYTSADTSDMMAAAQMPRPPYPPMSYHTPQSNSPASVASPSQHDQHRSIYAQPPSQHIPQNMYYQAHPSHYPSMQAQSQQSPYAQHAPQAHQPMPSQQSMMMSQSQQQAQQMHQASSQHHPQAQAQMTNSPRHMKQEPQVPLQMQKQQQPPTSHSPQPPNGSAMSTPTGSAPGGVNPNAAPGPIPATTPLVVRQDQNGVQWIAFEYSRDRVKMEYTIRCDVESVNTDELSTDFKTENCVYPRACVPKDLYRGNRQVYETECNTVGWALAQLNPSLQGKRGLIQRAVDSWRNSNQDPRLRSRRVRRQAKMHHRTGKPAGPPMPMVGSMDQAPPPAMMKMPPMGHATHGGAHGGGDGVADGEYMDEQHHHHHQAPTQPGAADDVRQSQVFNNSGYGGHSAYPAPNSSMSHMGGGSHGGPVTASSRSERNAGNNAPDDLFPNLPEAKKRKFILVDDHSRNSRLRVRVTLEGVNTLEIPDSFRKSAAVYPESYFPREMQSPPPSPTGSRFFVEDGDDGDDGIEDTNGRDAMRSRGKSSHKVKVFLGEKTEGEFAVPRLRRNMRGREVRLNDLGYRMAWLQSRVFAQRNVFLQRALDCYRNKTRSAIESVMLDIKAGTPHYETRIGKRKWNEKMRSRESDD